MPPACSTVITTSTARRQPDHHPDDGRAEKNARWTPNPSSSHACGPDSDSSSARRRAGRGAGVVSVLLSLPFAYSAAAASAVFAGLFAPAVGTLNEVLAGLGIAGPAWLQSPGWAVISIALTTAWYEFGFTFLVLLAALQALDPEPLEAAALDGAGEWRTAWSIILPAIRPSLLFLVVTQTISGLQIFTQIQVLTRGGPSGATSTIVYELYQRAFGEGLPDYGSVR